MLFIASRALSLRPKVAHVIDSLELFVASKAMNTGPKVIHVNHNLKMLQ